MGNWFVRMFEDLVFRMPVLLSYCINGRDDLLDIVRVIGHEAIRPIGGKRSGRKSRVEDGLECWKKVDILN